MTGWHDMHVLVTGGSSGIGLAVAERAARRGAHVTLVARDTVRLEAARESVTAARASDAQRVAAHSADVASWSAMSETVREAEAALGPVDILVTSAGYCYPARFVDMSAAEIEDQIGVNLLGTVYATRAVAPSMIERGHGHIAMISSMGGLIGVYGYGGYSPAKFGVIGLAEVLRCELKPHGIGVSVVCPPNVNTPGYAREVAIEPPETARINGNAKAMDPDAVARHVIAAIDRRRFMVLPGTGYGLLARLKGLVPEVFFAMFDRDVAAARKAVEADAV
ncbi:MAG: SDR family oxidoreductase [Coriobacteriia bacterium]|nr:SDR family oxidoreductase [Coriobacteriia bacterium]